MGATNPILVLQGKSGNTYNISLYFAGGDAAGYRVPATMYLAASSSSPTEWAIPEPCTIKYITGPATGTLRVLADGIATPLLLNTAAVIAKATDSQITWGNLAGVNAQGSKTKYTLVVEVAMAA